MAEVKEYTGITRGAVDCLRNDLKSMGISAPAGDNMAIEYMGVKLQVAYAEDSQKLDVTIVQKPVFIQDSMVWQFLDGKIQKCKTD